MLTDGSRRFVYDAENRLVAVKDAQNNLMLSIAYDPLGRILETVGSGATTRFVYDGDRLIGEYGAGAYQRRYVHGVGVDEPLVWYEGASRADRRWLHADRQGSIVAYSYLGGTTKYYKYGPYGEVQDWADSRFRYTGQIALPEAELFHYKARVYDPKIGRFLQTDPIGYKDDFNLYAYVGNDPLNNADPSGVCGSRVGGEGSSCSVSGEVEQSQIARAKNAADAIGKGATVAEHVAEQSARGTASGTSQTLSRIAADAKLAGRITGIASEGLGAAERYANGERSFAPVTDAAAAWAKAEAGAAAGAEFGTAAAALVGNPEIGVVTVPGFALYGAIKGPDHMDEAARNLKALPGDLQAQGQNIVRSVVQWKNDLISRALDNSLNAGRR